MIFGRPIKDFIPILPSSYRPHNTWIKTSRAREEAMHARNVRNVERPAEHTVRLQPLKVGNRVFIQNQTGNHLLRWDRTGLVIEVEQLDQYVVRVDGSGRVTLRKRKFLRKIDNIVVDHISGTTHTIQPSKTPNNAENLSWRTPKLENQAMVMAGRDTQAKKEKCKAWDKICSKCDKKNHFANVCRSKPKKIGGNTSKDLDESNTVFLKMCNISVACTVISHETGKRAVVLDHHIFDDKNGWITRRTPPQPTVFPTARAFTQGHARLR